RPPSRLVGRRGILRDEPFPAFLQRPLVQRRRIVGHLLAEADGSFRLKADVSFRLTAEATGLPGPPRARRPLSCGFRLQAEVAIEDAREPRAALAELQRGQ